MNDPDLKILIAFALTVILMTVGLGGMVALVVTYLS